MQCFPIGLCLVILYREIKKSLQSQDIVEKQVDEITANNYSVENYFNNREKIRDWIVKILNMIMRNTRKNGPPFLLQPRRLAKEKGYVMILA